MKPKKRSEKAIHCACFSLASAGSGWGYVYTLGREEGGFAGKTRSLEESAPKCRATTKEGSSERKKMMNL